jgi:heme a synthase
MIGIFLITSMVVVGGITRLTGSGLSIVEWKVLSGTLPPLTNEQWLETFEKYKQFPEYQKLNQGMSLSGFKSIFWWEYSHRLLGRITGLIFIVPFLFFIIKRALSPSLVKKLLFIMFLGGLQGLMGWIMVKSGLHDIPHVSHYRLAAHLSLALLLVAYITWTIAELKTYRLARSPLPHALWKVALAATGLVAVQIIYGAFVAGLKAGFSYNTYPLMHGEILPAYTLQNLTLVQVFDNGIVVQFIHRWMAIAVLGAVLYLYYLCKNKKLSKSATGLAAALSVVVLIQVTLGIATLVLAVPLVLGVLHQLVAVVLLIIAVLLVFQLRVREFSKFVDTPGAHTVSKKSNLNKLQSV